MGFFKRRKRNVIEQAIQRKYGTGQSLGGRIKTKITQRIQEHKTEKRKEKEVYKAAFQKERKKALKYKARRDARKKTFAPSLLERVVSGTNRKSNINKIKIKRRKKSKSELHWDL
ncbi:hypothetical protein GQ473_02480 [archaeon]|nr:hypothetical protein [archaeon]